MVSRSKQITDLRNRIETLESLVATIHGSLQQSSLPVEKQALPGSDNFPTPSISQSAKANGYDNDILAEKHMKWNIEAAPLERSRAESGYWSTLPGCTWGDFSPSIEHQAFYSRPNETQFLLPELAKVQPVAIDTNQCVLFPEEQAYYSHSGASSRKM
ncbi:hypothetical protein L228DRAFT_160903 [Xylona heveae TC161]|uniref:Uncharacterized protein n=1 Tax=Xylona heveae (strain CBS 132557 / TC161) TaxID=1328760 RepID=A0A165G7T7_XYLHT|nr:hypothetical protein L228DRAFT_160903 [Xylona heveae TC161]KZF21839.1 hypothetical protein L228DRAFT_160903 [Xylona heveae TC161]